MESFSNYATNWNDLPNELKGIIVFEAGKNGRLVLRACSKKDQQLVDSFPFRTIHKMCIWTDDNKKWHIDMHRTMYGGETSFVLNSFEEFQTKLTEEIENSNSIDLLEAYQKATSGKLRLTRHGRPLQVRELIFAAHNEDILDLLEQIDADRLEQLQLYNNGDHEGVFNTPQVKNVPYLWAFTKQMTDEQLLKLPCPELLLEGTENITTFGLNKFIKQCVLNLDKKKVGFQIEFNEPKFDFDAMFRDLDIEKRVADLPRFPSHKRGNILVNSTSSNFQLEIEYNYYYVKGKTICKCGNERQENANSFKSAKYVTIEADGRLTIKEKNTVPVTYLFDSAEELQQKLIEEIRGMKYIKHLMIRDTTHDWNFHTDKAGKLITVGKLSLFGGANSPHFIRQIESIHLKEITIHGQTDNQEIYNMPQLIHAEKFDVANCSIGDEQLLKSNATQYAFNTADHQNLTDAGINTFIKTLLTKLDQRDYNFRICFRGENRSLSDRLEGLHIFSQARRDRMTTKYVLNSLHPKYKMELLEMEGTIMGKRILRDE